MTDRDEAQSDEIRTRLDHIAGSIDVGEFATARADVDDAVARRRTRKRLSAGFGIAAAIALVATTAVLTVGGDDPDTLATTDDTMAPDTSTEVTEAPDVTVEAPEPTIGVPAGSGQAVERIDGAAQPGATAGVNGAPEFGEWIVPWDDGFLVGTTSFTPQPLPDELPEEVLALFPQDVIDLFGGELPDTISEATERLSEAELLDVVSRIIRDNPEASAAIYGEPVEGPSFDVAFTVDGSTWEPREISWPDGLDFPATVTTVGDRLVVVYQVFDRTVAQRSSAIVASTTDLVEWTTQELTVPPPAELPEGFDWMVFPQGFAANESGWVLPIYSSVQLDPYALLPADVVERAPADGFSFGPDQTGLRVDFYTEGDDAQPETLFFTWEELGVPADIVPLVADADLGTPTMWAANWDGTPRSTGTDLDGSLLVATPAGFVQWTDQTLFSPDGFEWTTSPLPEGASRVSGAFVVDGGLVTVSADAGGAPLIHRTDDRGENAMLLDVPGLPVMSLEAITPYMSPATSGTLLAASPIQRPEDRLSVEADGFRMSIAQPSFLIEVVDLATGEVVATGSLAPDGDESDSPITIGPDGITVTDPATGDVLVEFTNEQLEASEDMNVFDDFSTELWLLASADGERFVVDDLEAANDSPVTLGANGDRLLVQSGGRWSLYDLA